MPNKIKFTVLRDSEPFINTDEVYLRAFVNRQGEFILDGCRANSGNMPIMLCRIKPNGHAWNYLEGFRALGIEPNPSNELIISLTERT